MNTGPSFGNPLSAIRDNHRRGTVAEFLRKELKPGADLDLVTAYFTVFAFEKLRVEARMALVDLTATQTEQGQSMGLYSGLLAASVDAITATFQNKLAAELQRSRQFILPTLDEQVRPDSEFELVTWLVILEAGQPQ